MIYAEEVNYWQTSRSSADQWIEKAKAEIRGVKGQIIGEAFGADASGKAAFMLHFRLGEDQFKIIFPVLPSKTGKTSAAKIQAATILYHDVKAKCVLAKVLGLRTAFLPFLLLPDGRTASQASNQELVIPQILGGTPQLVAGEVLES